MSRTRVVCVFGMQYAMVGWFDEIFSLQYSTLIRLMQYACMRTRLVGNIRVLVSYV